ncbi:hypothetical protein JHK85_000694 [Glycine max]|uniref:Replication protein A 70 kDa DNA-binding subunit B/D first OB fold domain-containing protein n=1 Tax=Glycine max TaxID=3847 RepID=K7K283_SOYBN|nr:hypothetical protein JHK85_000694 [Glycine max]KAH1161920.1 hypothetical protein GYH30_000687 [Glycine max]
MLVASKQPTSSASVRSPELDPYSATNTLIAFDKHHQKFILGPCFLNDGENTDKTANKPFNHEKNPFPITSIDMHWPQDVWVKILGFWSIAIKGFMLPKAMAGLTLLNVVAILNLSIHVSCANKQPMEFSAADAYNFRQASSIGAQLLIKFGGKLEYHVNVMLDFGVRLWFPVRDFRSSVVEELAGLCNFMARIPDKIMSIDGSKETLKLAVRITDPWFVGTPNKSEQAEMVFVDSEGDQIHAICKSDHLKSWKADLKENCTYVMHNFKGVKNDGQFRVCEHEYKLFFIGVMVVREDDLHELPFKEFRFVEFPNVVAGNFVSGLLVDIIGVVDQVVFRHVSSKNTRVVFRMKDLSGEILSCTLWEHYCAQFLSYLNERGDDGPMVVILTHARIKDAQGSYPTSVSNSFKASKLLINDPILEIQEFKERKTDIQTGSFTCGCGKDNDHPVLRYRVEVMVTQNNESGKFLLWDRECAELIGQTADGVNRVKIEDGDLDLNASPQALDKLLGHVLAFKACSKIDPSNVDCNDATHVECQFLSATTDHDPVAGLPLTPKKRMSSDEADDELGSSQISPAQLSSNKLTRHSHRS